MKNTKILSSKIIRVRFKRDKKNEFYKTIPIKEISFSDNTVEYFHMKSVIEYGKSRFSKKDFITKDSEKWVKGETPKPKRKEKNKGIEGKRRGTKKKIDNIIKQKQENTAIKRATHRELKNKRILNNANSKKGIVTVEYTFTQQGIKIRATKVFPSKGLLRNEDFKRFVKQFFDSETVIKFRRKRGQKETDIKKANEARIAYRNSEKHLKKKQEIFEKRKTEYNKLSEESVKFNYFKINEKAA